MRRPIATVEPEDQPPIDFIEALAKICRRSARADRSKATARLFDKLVMAFAKGSQSTVENFGFVLNFFH